MVTVNLASADTLTRGGRRVDIPGLLMDGHGYSGIRGYSDMGWSSLDYLWIVTVTLASTDIPTRWGGRVDIPGLSMDGHSYSGIHGYCDKGGGGRVDIPALSMDGHDYSGIRGYSDKGGGRVDIPGLSMDGHGYSAIRGYSDMGGKGEHPWTIHGWSRLLCHPRILRHGGEGWSSLDYPWMVTVTLASMDTVTRGGGGRVDIPALSMDGHDYSGIHGYSDKGGGEGWTSLDYPWMVTVTLPSADTQTWGGGGGRVVFPGLSVDGHSYSGIHGYCDKGGGGGEG